MKKIILSLAILISPAVMAGSWSISIGSASTDENLGGASDELNSLPGELIDDTITSFEFGNFSISDGNSFSIGYEFNRELNFSYGVRFFNSGDLDIRIPFSASFQDSGVTGLIDGAFGGSLKVTSLDIYANYFIPISEKFELFATLGLGRWNGTWDLEVSGIVAATNGVDNLVITLPNDSLGEQDIGDGTSVFYGLGLSYNVNEKISARIQFENNSSDVDNTSISVLIEL